MEQTTSKRTYNISFLIMLFCIFCFTVGQFIPIYFTDTGFRTLFYFVIYILLVIAVARTIFKRIHKSRKENVSSAWFYSILFGFATFVIFGLWTLGLFFSVWTEASTLYVKKDNPKIKIIRRYVNEGAFGGGTEPDDYQIVLHRPILFMFKMETSIDTAKIDRANWLQRRD
jgi:amino acid transporter